MAIEKGNKKSMKNLVQYYKDNKFDIKALQLYIQHINLADRNEIILLFNNITSTQLDSINKEIFLRLVMEFEFIDEDNLCVSLELLLSMIKNKISILDLHFTYTMNGKGYEEAKTDYFNKCLGK